MQQTVVDADGHVIESFEGLYDFVDGPFRGAKLGNTLISPLPWIDGWHTLVDPGRWTATDAKRWGEFMDATGISASVLYPTAGLAHGIIENPDWAARVARAYNRWLHASHLQPEPRLHAVALLPAQDVSAAVEELRYSVTELGMCGGMLPSVTHMGTPYGDPQFDPIYAEAERLNVPIVLHGGSNHGLGLERMKPFGGTMPLHHPLALMLHFNAMLYSGTFERFPRLKVGFFEAGSSWAAYLADRLDYMFGVFKGIDPDYLVAKQSPSEILSSGRIYVTCEPNEKYLDAGLRALGSANVLYASDFPHELEYEEYVVELQKLLNRADIEADTLQKIVGASCLEFYGLNLAV